MSLSRVARSMEMPSAWLATTASLIGIMVSGSPKQVHLGQMLLLPQRQPWRTSRSPKQVPRRRMLLLPRRQPWRTCRKKMFLA